jgi:hypothetical protein
MDDFSFAYMQEAFVATLLVLARGEEPDDDDPSGGMNDLTDDWERNKFYRVMKAQVKILRDDMGSSSELPVPESMKSSSSCLLPQTQEAEGESERGMLSYMSPSDGFYNRLPIRSEGPILPEFSTGFQRVRDMDEFKHGFF